MHAEFFGIVAAHRRIAVEHGAGKSNGGDRPLTRALSRFNPTNG